MDQVTMNKIIEALKHEFTVENGYEHNITIPYGDTHAFSMNFGTDSVERTLELTKIASGIINKILKIPETSDITYKLQNNRYVAIPKRNIRNN